MDIVITPQERERTHSFLGKTAGDLTVPHVSWYHGNSVSGLATVPDPYNMNQWRENENSLYRIIGVRDGTLLRYTYSGSVAGHFRSGLFSFSLADTLGGSLDRIRQHTKLHGVWWGRAQGVNGEAVNYESEVYAWNRTTSQYDKVGEGGARFERDSVALNPDTGVEEVANQPRYVGGNYSLRFDGSGASQCWVPHNDAFYPSEGFTMEVWVKSDRPYPGTTSSTVYTSIMGQADGGTASRLAYVLDWNGTSSTRTLRFLLSDGTNIQTLTSSNASLEDWTHLVATFDGSNMVLYRNGEQIATRQVPQGFTINRLTNPFCFGRIGGFQSFPGKVDGGRYYNFALTPAEVADRYAKREIARKPIAHYGFDEGQGTTAHDTAERINLLPPNVANGGEDGTTVGVLRYYNASVESSTDEAKEGTRSFKVVCDGTASLQGIHTGNVEKSIVGKTYTASAWVKAEPGVSLTFRLREGDSSSRISVSNVTGTGEWQRVHVTRTLEAAPGRIEIRTDGAQATTFYVDGLQLQEGTEATPWTPPKLQPYDGTIEGAEFDQDNPFFEQGGFGSGLLVEEGTTNLVPADKQRFEGWEQLDGATVTVTQGYGIPGVTDSGATRIQASGGTGLDKYRYRASYVQADIGTAWSMWVYNIGTEPCHVFLNSVLGTEASEVTVLPGEVKRISAAYSGGSNHFRQFIFRADDPSGSIDVVAYEPQIEVKPYPTSFTTGTRAPESLRIPTAGVLNAERGQIDIDIHDWGRLREGSSLLNTLPAHTSANVYRNLQVYMHSDSIIRYRIGGGDTLAVDITRNIDAYKDGKTHRLTLRYTKGENAALFVDGVKLAEVAANNIDLSLMGDLLDIGSARWSDGRINTSIHGFRVLTEPMSDAEIAAEYGKPLTANVHTTCLLDFNRNLASIMPIPFELPNASDYVDDDGKVHILTRPKYPSDGTTPAEVATDYVELRSRQGYVSKPKVTNKGRNLINISDFDPAWNVKYDHMTGGVVFSTALGSYGRGLFDSSSGSTSNRNPEKLVRVEPGKSYTLQVKGLWATKSPTTMEKNNFRVSYFGPSGEFLSNGPTLASGLTIDVPPQDVTVTFTVPDNGYYIDIIRNSPSSTFGFESMKLELGDTATEYEDSQAQIVEVDTDLTAGDVLRIDSDERKVWKNGEEVSPELVRVVGGWPKFTSGKNTIIVEDELKSLMSVRITWQENVAHLFDEVDVSAEQQIISDAIASTKPLTLYTSSSLEGVEWILQWSKDGVRWFDDKVLIDEGTSRIRVIEPKARKIRLVARNTTDATITVSAFVEAKGDE